MMSAVTRVEMPMRPGSNSMSCRAATSMPSIRTGLGEEHHVQVDEAAEQQFEILTRVVPEADARDGDGVGSPGALAAQGIAAVG